MNPITQKILVDLDDPTLTEFVGGWGALEQLVIIVYRGSKARRTLVRKHRQIRRQLQEQYPDYAEVLAPYWAQATIGGEPASEDPFEALLAVENARGFIDNWAIMQTLPAVRQAINEWLVDRLAAKRGADH
ncbi:MAG: hypothetical protein GYB64_15655 [Chloroflexi bacterium]|nr:hypothetical protein [Chloroflexota bacterium]